VSLAVEKGKDLLGRSQRVVRELIVRALIQEVTPPLTVPMYTVAYIVEMEVSLNS
jgi:hypothetical protein